tara:strand:+ start:405 stop:596 length:192 start_codon:yes stop_codon:yes gene_type:complete
MTHKEMHSLNTLYCSDGQLVITGEDENGGDFTVQFDAYHFLQWIDKETIAYIKKDVIKNVKSK